MKNYSRFCLVISVLVAIFAVFFAPNVVTAACNRLIVSVLLGFGVANTKMKTNEQKEDLKI